MLDSKFWQKYFKTYDVLNIVIPYQRLLEELCQTLEIKEGDLILDAGAGTGNLTVKLKKLGVEVIALDDNQEGLERLKLKDKDIKIVSHDLTKYLPFPDNYFNKIVSNNTVYIIAPEKRGEIFREFYRVLKPGGKIVISNVRKGWRPVEIYTDHIKEDLEKIGLFKLSIKALKMIIPTIKIFYYNFKIKKEEGKGNLMEKDEQKELLIHGGFVSISENKLVYAKQAILNSAIKPKNHEDSKGD